MDLRITQKHTEMVKCSSLVTGNDFVDVMEVDQKVVSSSSTATLKATVNVGSNVNEHTPRVYSRAHMDRPAVTSESDTISQHISNSNLSSVSNQDVSPHTNPNFAHNAEARRSVRSIMVKDEQCNTLFTEHSTLTSHTCQHNDQTPVKEIPDVPQTSSLAASVCPLPLTVIRPKPIQASQTYAVALSMSMSNTPAALPDTMTTSALMTATSPGRAAKTSVRRRKALIPKRAAISSSSLKATKSLSGKKSGSTRAGIITAVQYAVGPSLRPSSVFEQLNSVCDVFGGMLTNIDGDFYISCSSLLDLYPRIKWKTKRSVIIKVVQDIFNVYKLPVELRVLQSFQLDLEEPLMRVEAYLLILIRSYKDITVSNKPNIEQLIALYINLVSDRQEALVDMLSELKLDIKKGGKTIGPKSSRPVSPWFPVAEWSADSRRSCSSQTGGGAEADYLKTLPLKQQISNHSVIRKVAWVIQNDKRLNEVFWKAYNGGSASTINKVPNILTGDSSMVCDVKTQTEPACVPVLRLRQLNCNAMGAVKVNRSDMTHLQNNQNGLLDFVPNDGNTEKMEELFHSINANNYSDRWQAQRYEHLVEAKYAMSFHEVPATEEVTPDSTSLESSITGGISPDALTADTPCEDRETDFWTDTDDEDDELIIKPKSKRNTKRLVKAKTAKTAYTTKPRRTVAAPKIPKYKAAPLDRKCVICDKILGVDVNKGSCCPSHRELVEARYPDEKTKKEYVYTYSCPQCSYTSHQLVKLKSHVLIVHKGQDTEYKCEVCGKSLSCRKMFKRHKASHMVVKPYICETCGKGFSQPNNLDAHRRQHTGEKPFQCEHCGNSFTHNISLRKHFCKTLGRRIEPLDLKTPGKGRPSRRAPISPSMDVAKGGVDLHDKLGAPSGYIAPFISCARQN